MSNTNIITLNVKGINHVVKRRKILSMLKKDKVQVALLQETHLTDSEHLKLKRDWVGQIYYSSFNSKSRGVAILIHKHLQFTLEKVMQDTEGRYVVVTGWLYGERVLIGSAYAPSTFDSSFYSKLLADISLVCPPYVILGGDFNCVLAPEVDHSPPKTLPPTKMAQATKRLCSDLDLFDAWRVINPRDKDFTFFSYPHRSFSRIDYIFVSRLTLDRTTACSIKPCALSDHSLVSIELLPPYYNPLSRHWRLNPSLLSDPTFLTYLESQWELFISTNDSPEVSASTLWETGKAYLRGAIISYMAAKRKNTLAKQLELEQQIMTLDREFKATSSMSVFKKLEAARSALNQLLTQKAESAIFFAKHRLFEFGNKPGRLLARLAKGQTGSRVIPSLRDSTGAEHFETKSICKIFKDFYQKLYSSECQNTSELRDRFFDGIRLPTLSENYRNDLCRPITTQEVAETIKSLQSGKAPGPDGFGPEFYKKMMKIVVGPLTNLFTESFERGTLPPTLNLAHISMILKKDKPSDCCGSYRPISLLGVDCKILSKLLARRLEEVLPILVGPDQTGFVKNRYSVSNVRRLLNIIHFSNSTKKRVLAVSLDAEKAFDRVEWEYLFDVLDRFGLGLNFIEWVKLLYRSPVARVMVNGLVSDIFPLCRGTRQGCPLSPLLFALALEPLAETIRNHNGLFGVKLGDTEYRISLYADDILLFITKPEDSVSVLVSIICQFGQISGYKINYDKSEALPLGDFGDRAALVNFPFKWSITGFVYLGIRVSANVKELYKLNFSPVLTAVKHDLNRWFDLPLSWMGRISMIKMNVLPRILYPIQMLPLRINKRAILDIERFLSNFIWHGKRPRLKMKILQLPVDRGVKLFPTSCIITGLLMPA